MAESTNFSLAESTNFRYTAHRHKRSSFVTAVLSIYIIIAKGFLCIIFQENERENFLCDQDRAW